MKLKIQESRSFIHPEGNRSSVAFTPFIFVGGTFKVTNMVFLLNVMEKSDIYLFFILLLLLLLYLNIVTDSMILWNRQTCWATANVLYSWSKSAPASYLLTANVC